MPKGNGEVMTVTILPNTKSGPQGKLADAEVIFGAASGPLQRATLDRLRGMGTSRWREKPDIPARQYSVNGERRSFALLEASVPAELSV